MEPVYATRGMITRALEVMETSRSNDVIDEKLQAGARAVEGLLKRRFYPERRTVRMDWPNQSYAPTWEQDLGQNEAISLETVISGGTTIDPADYVLRRADDRDEPPYTRLEINLNSSAAFSGGVTFQRSNVLLGLFGFNDVRRVGGVVSGAINSSVATLTAAPINGFLTVDVGSILVVDTERMIVTGRRMATTAQTITANVNGAQSVDTVPVSSGAAFAINEVIAIDSERMRVVDIIGNNLTVERAFDGSTLADHTSGATVYASRLFNVERGALGSTADSHADAAVTYTQAFPGLITELNIAETVVLLEQNSAGYARTVGTGQMTREAAGKGLEDVRARAYEMYGRKQRSTAI